MGADKTKNHRPEKAPYQIVVMGEVHPTWSVWFDGMTLRAERGCQGEPVTLMTGLVADQGALRGILTRVWDLNLTLLSVRRLGRTRDSGD